MFPQFIASYDINVITLELSKSQTLTDISMIHCVLFPIISFLRTTSFAIACDLASMEFAQIF